MINHIVLWNFKDDVNKDEAFNAIKNALEPLKDKIDGITNIEVIKPKSTSTCTISLISSFEDETALNNYQNHPLHLEAVKVVKQYVTNRQCIDY